MGLLSISTRLLKTQEGVAQWLQHGKEALVANHGERAEQTFGGILEAQPETPEALQGLLTAWLLQGKSDQVIEYHDESNGHVQQQLREYLWIAMSMQVGHLTPEGYARWIGLPHHNAARLEGLQELSDAFSKCGPLAMDWANSALAAYRLDIAQQALKQVRDSQPRIPEREVARLYARRDAILLQEHPELIALINEASHITSPLERFDRLEPIARRNMDVAAIQREAGLALLEANSPHEAMRFFNRAVDINPYWLNAWIELGMAAQTAERLVRAKEAFTRAFHLSHEPWLKHTIHQLEDELEFGPHLPSLEIAHDRIEVGDFSGAVLPLKKAIKASDDPIARWTLGEVYAAQGDYSLASTYLRDAWADALESGQSPTPEQLSQLELSIHQQATQLLAAGELDNALDLLDEMLSSGEQFDLLREDQWIARRLVQEEISLKAFVLYENGRPRPGKPLEESLALIDKAVKDSEHFPEALVARAVLAAELGDLDAAYKDLKFALSAMEATGTGVFHMAGLAFLRQDLAMARALWQRSAQEGQFPWSLRSKANLNALETGRPQDLYIAWLPTHMRVIEYAPSASMSLDDLMAPSQEALLFEISPSQVLDAVEPDFNAPEPEEIKALAEAEVPRFSDLVPDDAPAQEPQDPLAFLSSDMLPQVPENPDDLGLFGTPKEEVLPSFLVDDEDQGQKEWDLGESQAAGLLPPEPAPKAAGPLFEISDQDDLNAEFPMDLIQEQAGQAVPKLSDVLPSTQSLDDFSQTSSLMDEPVESLDVAGLMTAPAAPVEAKEPTAPALPDFSLPTSAPESAPTQPAEVPFAAFASDDPGGSQAPFSFDPPANGGLLGSSDPPMAALGSESSEPAGLDPDALFGSSEQPAASATPSSDSSSALTSSLFGGDDDLSSFLDEAFLSLDNIEKK